MKEEPLQFGEGGRLFGMLTLPTTPAPCTSSLPTFVLLSAGLLHRVGPSRLHVRLARELAQLGFSTIRVDLSGKGDSPRRPGLTNQPSVAADYREIVHVLESRLGPGPRVLAGICSGADNAVRLTIDDPKSIGMVLLDPICFRDPGYRARATWAKYTTVSRYVSRVKHMYAALASPSPKTATDEPPANPLALRDLPSRDQMRRALDSVRKRGGRVLSVFTSYATGVNYYNQAGQLGRVLEIPDYDRFCTELFWPEVEHTYKLECDRRALIDQIKTMAGAYAR